MGLFNSNKRREKKQKNQGSKTVVKTPGLTYRVVRGTYRNFLNVPKWTSYDLIKEQSVGMFGFITHMFRKRHASRTETFEQAMLRLDLSESDIKKRYKQVRFQFWLYAVLGACIVAYAAYLLIVTTLIVSVLAFLVATICIVRAISMRFWMFQIRKRRLGCSLREWINSATLREGS